MNKTLLVLMIGLAVAAAGCSGSDSTGSSGTAAPSAKAPADGQEAVTGSAVGNKAPDFSLKDVKGNTVTLRSDGENQKVTLLVFWATWCPGCRQEIPEVNKFFSKYSGKGARTLSVNVDKGSNGVASFVEKADIDKLLEALKSKKSHRNTIDRDILLLVDLAIHTGLRRSELANLRVGDIDTERQVLVVRQGKGSKDRIIPLSKNTCAKLAEYIDDKDKGSSLLALAPASILNGGPENFPSDMKKILQFGLPPKKESSFDVRLELKIKGVGHGQEIAFSRGDHQ